MKYFFALVCVLASIVGCSQVVWSDDFSNPAIWDAFHNGSVDLDWQVGVGLTTQGPAPLAPIQSATAANGYALLDSDALQNPGPDEEQAFLTNAVPIDLSTEPTVRLIFESHHRAFATADCYVVISTNNTDWPALTNGMNITGMLNVFRIHNNLISNQTTANPETVTLDISQAIAQSPQTVWIRFYWAGISGYSWYVDDVRVEAFEACDAGLTSVTVSNSSFTRSFGSMPAVHIGTEFFLGATARNLSVTTQTDLALDVYVDGPAQFAEAFFIGDLLPGDSAIVSGPGTFVDLPNGSYTATFTLASVGSCDVDPSNNVVVRRFGVFDGVCALDGIDIIPVGEQMLGSLGTGSFVDGEDGLMFLSYIDLKQWAPVTGFEAVLAGGTQPGSYVTFSVVDSTDVLDGFVDDALAYTDFIEVTVTDIAEGRVYGTPIDPVVLPVGGYFVAVTLYSNAGSNTINIRDDLTYERGPLESLMYFPTGDLYSNGNAMAVRLLVGGVPECHAEYVVTQAVDAGGDPIPFVLTIVNTSTSDAPDPDWLWEFGDGATSTQQFPTHTYATNGPYEICLTISDPTGCTDQYCDSIGVDPDGMFTRSSGFTINVVAPGTIGYPDRGARTAPTFFPNPSTGAVFIAPIRSGIPAELTVFDTGGREVWRAVLQSEGDGRLAADLRILPPGLYAARLVQGPDVIVRSLVRIDSSVR